MDAKNKSRPSVSIHSHLVVKCVYVVASVSGVSCFCWRYCQGSESGGGFAVSRLRDVLYFVVLTAALSMGIVNSRGRDVDEKPPSRLVSRLGAAIFGERDPNEEEEEEEEEEAELPAAERRCVEKRMQQPKSGLAQDANPQSAPTAAASHSHKLAATVASGVAHMASLKCAIDRLAFHTSRSLQRRVDSLATPIEPQHHHHSNSETLLPHSNLGSPASLDRVQPEKSPPQPDEETARNTTFSVYGGLSSGESTVPSEEQKHGSILDHKKASSQTLLLPSSPLWSSSSSTSTVGEEKADCLSGRHLSRRSINVIRPSEMEMARVEETDTSNGRLSDDVNVKAEAFIAKVKEKMRLQLVEFAEKEKIKRLCRAI